MAAPEGSKPRVATHLRVGLLTVLAVMTVDGSSAGSPDDTGITSVWYDTVCSGSVGGVVSRLELVDLVWYLAHSPEVEDQEAWLR